MVQKRLHRFFKPKRIILEQLRLLVTLYEQYKVLLTCIGCIVPKLCVKNVVTLNDIYQTEELAHVLTDEMSNHNFDD